MYYSILTSHFRLYEPIVLKSVVSYVIYKGLQWLVLGYVTSHASITLPSAMLLHALKLLCCHTRRALSCLRNFARVPLCLKCSFSKWAHSRLTPLFHSSLCSNITPPKILSSFICLIWYLSLPEIIGFFNSSSSLWYTSPINMQAFSWLDPQYLE